MKNGKEQMEKPKEKGRGKKKPGNCGVTPSRSTISCKMIKSIKSFDPCPDCLYKLRRNFKNE